MTNENSISFLSPAKLTPFIKWPGGKSSELIKIAEAAPTFSGNFIEPFLGGGSVLLATNPAISAFANDYCVELIDLYKGSASEDMDLYGELKSLAESMNALTKSEAYWTMHAHKLKSQTVDTSSVVEAISADIDLSATNFEASSRASFLHKLSLDLPKKLNRIQSLELKHGRKLPIEEFADNLEGAAKAALYMTVRARYNAARSSALHSTQRTADFFFLREYCYASMFRFNAYGEFNVPYGGISYNRKNFASKVENLFSPKMRKRLTNTTFHTGDFEDFLVQLTPTKDDFIFVDPPYDSDFSDYDDQKFGASDQRRLEKLLRSLPAKIMIVISETPLINEIYENHHWKISGVPFTYKWNIKERNERKARHLTITNY